MAYVDPQLAPATAGTAPEEMKSVLVVHTVKAGKPLVALRMHVTVLGKAVPSETEMLCSQASKPEDILD